ncbi:hypothetical protein SODALDRAFT_345494 [Sodiomyces alkalinus F11]|uniref:Sec20 C-terminal domain-containing protein n=1 Tax=Sodiomyces alkalinus (strain CBS 110278 / VKM F-3762 / F11) TaxID=1314773 RepID=A0A3N2PQQ9_SODAK|nr:hypothetical protein SODALDRAFT_345494 [Sodiomyces alkalinus F11]ROT36815.1 hypothetical protein SODALDRAFT_345494 [Sodiomyces alkalinus F11]
MSLEGLQERLTALQETTTQLKNLIDRLQNIRFQPGSVPLSADEDNVATELSTEIIQILREEDEELELLEEEVEDLKGGRPGSEAEHTKMRLKDGVERLKQELKGSRVNFRKAQLSAKQSLARAQKLERELLLQSYSQPASIATSPSLGPLDDAGDADGASSIPRPETVRQQHQHQHQHQQQQTGLSEEDQQAVGASGNVTAALRRTHDLIAAELARSEFAHQTLSESSAALAKLDDSYGSLEGMLSRSRDLLGTLVKSQKSDTWYLQTALYMLLVTGAWLVFRRFLYGPVWWLVWFPLRMVFGILVGGGKAVVRRGEGGPAGESPGVAVQEGGRVEVEGIPGEELPTIQVGGAGSEAEESGQAVLDDIETIVERVGKVVDEVPELGEGEEAETETETENESLLELVGAIISG